MMVVGVAALIAIAIGTPAMHAPNAARAADEKSSVRELIHMMKLLCSEVELKLCYCRADCGLPQNGPEEKTPFPANTFIPIRRSRSAANV